MKRVCLLLFSLGMMGIFAACGIAKEAERENSAETESRASEEAAVVDAENSEQRGFKSGTWACTNGSNYIFYEDGKSGKIVNVANETSVGFEYEATSSGYVFHIGSADDNTNASVVFSEYNGDPDNRADITWEDEKTEVIVYASERTDDKFSYEGRGDLIIEDTAANSEN